MSLFLMLTVVTAAAMGAYYYWHEDAQQRGDSDGNRAYLLWLLKGLVVPLLLWTFFNSGWPIDALFPNISQAKGAGNWSKAFVPMTAAFLLYLASWWIVVTMAWIGTRVCLRTKQRIDFFATAAVWFLFALPAAFFILLLMGRGGIGVALVICGGSVVHGTLRLAPFEQRNQSVPTYSRAMAKIAFDKFNEAEMEIIHQLEKAENDFDGWMLLAELYAVHFHDLKTAEQTVCDICDDPNTNPAQVSIALNRLADWHLKFDNNPTNARWALEKLCERLPNTHMEKMARGRINQLPATREEYLQQQSRGHTVRMLREDEHQPLSGDESHGREQWLHAPEGHRVRLTARRPTPTSREVALQEASQRVEELKVNPDDVEARLHFATLLAESLDRADEAIEQLDLLLGMQNQPDAERARWLAMQADWHARKRNDPESARAVLQRIITETPQSREAFDAQRRIYLMQLEGAVKLKRRPLPGAKVTAPAGSPPRRA